MIERNDNPSIGNDNSATVDDWLERVLVADGREHRARYVNDDGFTRRVMQSLPSVPALPSWRTPALVLLWTCAVAAFVWLLPGLADDILREAMRLVGTQPISLSGIAMGLAALLAAAWAAAAFVLRTSD